MAGLTLKETAAASVPTPATDKATVFIDSADGLPKYKNDAGTVVSLGGSLADGDYGDVTVSSSGTVITIDDDAVTLPKIANQADQTILGNNTGGSASPSALTASQVRTLLGLVPGTDVQAYDSDLAAIAALSPSNDDIIQRKAGAWTNRTLAQLTSDLGVPTLAGTNTWTAQNTFAAGTITTSQPFTISQTWNAGGVTFEGLLLDFTSSASAAASLAMNVKVGGVSQFSISKGGIITADAATASSAPPQIKLGSSGYGLSNFTSGTTGLLYGNATNFWFYVNQTRLSLTPAQFMGWGSGAGNATGTLDTALYRNAAGVVEINNGTAGTYRDLKLRNVVGQTGYTEMTEMTAPGAGAANTVRFYAEDNGSGKTRIMAVYSDGSTDQISIQP